VDAVSLTVLDDATGRAWATSAMDESFFATLKQERPAGGDALVATGAIQPAQRPSEGPRARPSPSS